MSLWRAAKSASVFVALAIVTFTSPSVFAQAWVGEAGGLGLSLDYSFGRSDRIIETFENRNLVPGGEFVNNHNVALGIEYAPIDNLGLTASIPIVATQYDGPEQSFPPHGRYDDGSFHTVLQDFRFIARYMVLDAMAPVTISPHIGFSVPMTGYETVGYAGAGRGLNQLHIGVSLGKYFTSGVPDLYVHGNVEFSLVEPYETAFEETAELGQNKTDIKFLVGYFITEKLEVNLATDFRLNHGGLEFEEFLDQPVVIQNHHDPLIAERFLLAGGGVSYQALDKLRVSAFFRLWAWGENTRNANLIGGGVSYDVM